MQKLYSENRKEKMELLKGLTLGRDDTANISPLQQVPFDFFSTYRSKTSHVLVQNSLYRFEAYIGCQFTMHYSWNISLIL